MQGLSRDAPIYLCASCGYRSIDASNSTKKSFVRMRLSELSYLQLDDESKAANLRRMETMDLELPTNNNGGDMKTFELWKSWNIWPQQKLNNDEHYYFLHPELVEPDITKDKLLQVHHSAWLCGTCSTNVKKEKDPPLSLKAGTDFGSFERVGLTPLSLMERHIVSKVRHYSQVVKIESNSGRQIELMQCAIKGCCIVFDHDAPAVCVDLLSQGSITANLFIHFVGPQGSHDTLLQKTRSTRTSHLFARAYVMYQWMESLMKINPLYKDEPDLPLFHNLRSNIEASIGSLLEHSLATQDDEATERTEIAGDDVAGIRSTSQNRVNDDNREGDLALRYTYLTSADKTAFDSHTDTTHEYLSGVANTIGVDVEVEMNEYREGKSRRAEDPLNEFADGQLAFLGGGGQTFFS